MQLTQFTDYSLRALVYIALRKESCTINEITLAYAISANNMNKIIHNLAKLELIQTTRGKHGGIVMSANTTDINLGALVSKLEPNFDLVPCFNAAQANCCIAPVCKLKTILHEAQAAFMKILNQFTLADIIQNKNELNALLNMRTY
jgi:Rrf2 family nitric oxide-sensitive transcriptional repressor